MLIANRKTKTNTGNYYQKQFQHSMNVHRIVILSTGRKAKKCFINIDEVTAASEVKPARRIFVNIFMTQAVNLRFV